MKKIFSLILTTSLGIILGLFLIHLRGTESSLEESKSTYGTESLEGRIEATCEAVRSMDFIVNEPQMDVSSEENTEYLEVYLKVLKNEMPVRDMTGEEKYYKDLWKAGIEFEKLLEKKSERESLYLYYYDDLDGYDFQRADLEMGVTVNMKTGERYMLDDLFELRGLNKWMSVNDFHCIDDSGGCVLGERRLAENRKKDEFYEGDNIITRLTFPSDAWISFYLYAGRVVFVGCDYDDYTIELPDIYEYLKVDPWY